MFLPTSLYANVFQIRNHDFSGTSFRINYKNKDFIISAKHLIKENNNFEIFILNDWHILNKSPMIAENNADIIAFDFSEYSDLLKDIYFLKANYTPEGLNIGGDVYFCGFPYGFKTYSTLNKFGFKEKLPLVKKAIFSGVFDNKDTNALGFYLDGHNNPGFSGGPCIYQKDSNNWQIFGIISSYIPNLEHNNVGNSGIFLCHNIIFILNTIDKYLIENL